jgi:hypothetical protein
MKKVMMAVGFGLMFARLASADTAPGTYFEGYVYVGASTNAGNTGLATNTPYLCFPLATLTNIVQAGGLTAANAATNGDVRAIMYSLVNAYWYGLTLSALENSTCSKTNVLTSDGYSATEWVTHTFRTKRIVLTSQVDAE